MTVLQEAIGTLQGAYTSEVAADALLPEPEWRAAVRRDLFAMMLLFLAQWCVLPPAPAARRAPENMPERRRFLPLPQVVRHVRQARREQPRSQRLCSDGEAAAVRGDPAAGPGVFRALRRGARARHARRRLQPRRAELTAAADADHRARLVGVRDGGAAVRQGAGDAAARGALRPRRGRAHHRAAARRQPHQPEERPRAARDGPRDRRDPRQAPPARYARRTRASPTTRASSGTCEAWR